MCFPKPGSRRKDQSTVAWGWKWSSSQNVDGGFYLSLSVSECQGFWKRLLRVPWTARRSSQSVLKEINPGYPLEGLMLKLKLQYFGHLMQRADSLKRPWCWEGLKEGGEEDDRKWDGWMASPTRWIWVWASSRSWWWTGKPGVLQSRGSQRVRHDWATEQNWLKWKLLSVLRRRHLLRWPSLRWESPLSALRPGQEATCLQISGTKLPTLSKARTRWDFFL